MNCLAKTITTTHTDTITTIAQKTIVVFILVCRGSELEQALVGADSDPRKLEKTFGMDERYLVDNPYVVRVANIKGVII